MAQPADLLYSKEHEWVKLDGDSATIGITDYAQNALGDIVYVELPDIGAEVAVEEDVTEIESTKTTAPVVAPVGGRIVEINEELKDAPELVNEDPYGKGWIMTIEMSDPAEADELMDAKEYAEFLKEQS